MENLKNRILKPLKTGKDYVIAVTGDVGEGKSTSAINLSEKLYPDFDMWKNIIYTGSIREYEEKYEILEERGVLIFDEAIELMYALDFMKSNVKDLVKNFAAKHRKEKHAIYILNIPHLTDLTKYWREKRVKMWIELLAREAFKKDRVGAVVFEKERIPFLPSSADVWLMKSYYKKYMKMIKKGYNVNTALDILEKHPYFVNEVTFKKFKKSKYAKYLNNRKKALKKYHGDEKLQGRKDRHRTAHYNLVAKLHSIPKECGITLPLSYEEVCLLTNFSHSSYSHWFKKKMKGKR